MAGYRTGGPERARAPTTIIVDPKALEPYTILVPGVTTKRKDGGWIRIEEAHQQGNAVAAKFAIGYGTSSAIRWARIMVRPMSFFPGYLVGLVPL